jgi:hypothetical protein
MTRDRPPALGLGWLSSLVGSVVLGVLLFVTALEMRSGHLPAPPPSATHVDCINRLSELPAQIARATALIEDAGLSLPPAVEEPQGADRLRYVHRRYEVELPPAVNVEQLHQRLAPLREHDPCVSVEIRDAGTSAVVAVGIDEVLTHTIVVHWVVPTPARIRVAIVIDDLGGDLLAARALTTVDAPIAFAVVPFRPFSREVAELAKLFGREVLLDLPTDFENAGDTVQVLQINMDRPAIDELLAAALESVPHAVGATSRMATAFPRDRQRMRWVLSWLGARHLFFIEAAATTELAAVDLAASIGMAAAAAHVALDDIPDEPALRARLDGLLQQARDGHAAIAIGRPLPATIDVLRAILPAWREHGIEILPVSSLLPASALAAQ